MKPERTVLENEHAYDILTTLTVKIQWANCAKQCDLETWPGKRSGLEAAAGWKGESPKAAHWTPQRPEVPWEVGVGGGNIGHNPKAGLTC